MKFSTLAIQLALVAAVPFNPFDALSKWQDNVKLASENWEQVQQEGGPALQKVMDGMNPKEALIEALVNISIDEAKKDDPKARANQKIYMAACLDKIGFKNCKRAKVIADEVTKLTFDLIDQKVFVKGSNSQGKADAFRHCYWHALLTIEMGEDVAKEVGVVHENVGDAFQTAKDHTMDASNNQVGIAIGYVSLQQKDTMDPKENALGRCKGGALQGNLFTMKE